MSDLHMGVVKLWVQDAEGQTIPTQLNPTTDVSGHDQHVMMIQADMLGQRISILVHRDDFTKLLAGPNGMAEVEAAISLEDT